MVEIEFITYTLTLFVRYLNIMPGAFVKPIKRGRKNRDKLYFKTLPVFL